MELILTLAPKPKFLSSFWLKYVLSRCFRVAIALILFDRPSPIRMCQKADHVICDVGIEGFHICHSEL
jgi:hypothetical protein